MLDQNRNSAEGQQHNKDRKYNAELKQVRAYLSDHNATATMVSFALKIYRPNLCRHKYELQRSGLLAVTHRGFCLATGFKADYLTCNPEIVKNLTGKGKSVEIQFPDQDGV